MKVDDQVRVRSRLYALGIDLGILSVALAISFSLVAQLAILGRSNNLMDFLAFMLGLLAFFAPALYFWILTWRTGQTIGKRIMGLVVVDQEGRTLSLGRSFLREVVAKFLFNLLGMAIPLCHLSFLWITQAREKRGWHDSIAGTYVRKAESQQAITQAPRLAKDRREVLSLALIGAVGFLIAFFFGSLIADYVAESGGQPTIAGDRPLSISDPLDERFVGLGNSSSQASKQEWQRLLAGNHGRSRIVPLSPLDPSKDLLVFVPGIGVTFQDAYAIAQLEDKYQVVIGIYDRGHPLDRNGRQLSEAIEDLGAYLKSLDKDRGVQSKRELRIIGHSLGGLVATLSLVDLAEREIIGTRTESLFSEVIFIEIDAPWRGFDAPWIVTLPGVKHVLRELLPRLPLPLNANRSALSIINRTSSMNAVLEAQLPTSITVHLVTVVPDPETLRTRSTEPVDGWYSIELSDGELDSIQEFLISGDADLNKLDQWEWSFLVRRQNLQQLFRTLQRDGDYPNRITELRSVANQLGTLNQFRTQYDVVIDKIAETFQGQHTRFMWEDKRFLPWLRAILKQTE